MMMIRGLFLVAASAASAAAFAAPGGLRAPSFRRVPMALSTAAPARCPLAVSMVCVC